jgi:hypothetical protein
MKKLILLLSLSALLAAITSCNRRQEGAIPAPARAVYYWKTVFSLDSTETAFLKNQAIKKIYLRYFDVDFNNQGMPVPVGTLQLDAKVPKGVKVIPVVYIENHCLVKAEGLASKIVKRVLTMSAANDIAADELQLDCDWTNSTQQAYFGLLS